MSGRCSRRPITRRDLIKLLGLAGPILLLGPELPVRLASAAPAHQTSPFEDDPFRLPRTVVPERYVLTIAPDFAASSFTGEVSIAVQVREPVQTIVLNAADLEIAEAFLTDASAGRLDGTITLQPD